MIRRYLDKILEWTLCTILIVMVVDVTWQILSRYAFNNPSSFTDELASFLLIWLGILGGAYVYGKGEHLSINFLVEKYNAKYQFAIKVAVESLVLLFSLSVMVVGGVWLVWSRFLLGVESAALQINWGYVYMVLPLSGLIIAFYATDRLFNLLKK